ncbi:MAG: hypothetical protein LBR89_01990 [Holosporales bacterium]|nr:hypothetical protein [Holosporales bacterium]
MNERLRRADVFFDVAKTSSGIELIGSINGNVEFRASTHGVTTSFYGVTPSFYGYFFANFVKDGIDWKYCSDGGVCFHVLVKLNGDMTLRGVLQNEAGRCHEKSFAFRTFGRLENVGNIACSDLVTSAKQFHNFGSIQSYNGILSQHFLFNSGFMQFGLRPEKVTSSMYDVSRALSQRTKPTYNKGVFKNSGTFCSHGECHMTGRLNYVEDGYSEFGNLQMSGGSISVGTQRMYTLPRPTTPRGPMAPPQYPPYSSSSSDYYPPSFVPESNVEPEPSEPTPAMMTVHNILFGEIDTISVGNASIFNVHTFSVPSVNSVSLENGAIFHSGQHMNLYLNEFFENRGVLSSSVSINLQINAETKIFGIVMAMENVELSLRRFEDLIRSEISMQGVIISPHKVIHIDTYSRETPHDQGPLDECDVPRESVYSFQKRTTMADESNDRLPSVMQMSQQEYPFQLPNCSIEEYVNYILSERKRNAAQEKEYIREVVRVLLESGSNINDIFEIRNNPLLSILRNGKGTAKDVQYVQRQYPRVCRWLEHCQWTSEVLSNQTNGLSYIAARFFHEIVVLVSVLEAEMDGYGTQYYEVVDPIPVLVDFCARLKPVLKQASIALEIDDEVLANMYDAILFAYTSSSCCVI